MSNTSHLIEKKILFAGTKSVDFKNGTKVHFHYQARVCNKERTLIDDSKKLGQGKPIELVLGKKFKLEVWEVIVQQMAEGEVAQFTIDKSLVLQYPFVSKTLRDAHKPPEQRVSHCCAMTLQSEGVGYPDLNDLLKDPQNLEFTIELLKVENPEDYEKEAWQLTDEERLKLVPELRERGNLEYKEKNYSKAAQTYSKAIGILEQLMMKEKPHDEEWESLNARKLPLLLNYAQCVLQEGDFYGVIEHCTTVLKDDPNNVKAYYRRGKAHVGAWNPEEAKVDFNKALELDPSIGALIKKELEQLDLLVKAKDAEDQKKYKNLFN